MNQSILPLVSIGMPLYNEDRFIEESLISLLSQDYENVEIIISDNASTDDTAQICQRFIDLDYRISYHQFEVNKGATHNFEYVLNKSSGVYFMWAAGHDIWSSNYISECVQLLEDNHEATIAFGSSIWIDENGNNMTKTSGWSDTRGLCPTARFFTVFWGNMNPVLGLIRASNLKALSPFTNFAGADLVLLSQLALQGNFVHATKSWWQRRDFRHEKKHLDKLKRYKSAEFGVSRSFLDRYFPLFRLPLKVIEAVIESKLPWLEKIGILSTLLSSFPLRYLIGKR